MEDMNKILEAAVWVFGALLIVLLVPRSNYREACISFLFIQVPTWVLGLVAVQLGLLQYPSRFLAYASGTSFTYEFFALPVVSAIYNLYYPSGKKPAWRVGYIFIFAGSLTGAEMIIEKYTDLVEYIHWHWSISLISVTVTLQCSQWFYSWFLKGRARII
ncbi:CBO0543 family protein [Paenibacillus piri]|uniref:Uncharacterized protein n=1 Tax=Paenibacillus piri TaxID=2547395 RepID=A0A4R5KQS8_9BACL|nr:CBO0543 family protein [Paenibacillus piri]TDF97100.1 hypothetical protein E1757_14760 [Paenibacillus piri]